MEKRQSPVIEAHQAAGLAAFCLLLIGDIACEGSGFEFLRGIRCGCGCGCGFPGIDRIEEPSFPRMFGSMRPVLTLLLLVLLLPCADTTAEEWTRFRGPNGSGISTATGIPVIYIRDLSLDQRGDGEHLAVAEEIAPHENDAVFTKIHGDAMTNPDLVNHLEEAGIERLLISGIASRSCRSRT